MLFNNLVHLKGLLMVLTATVGTVAGGTMLSSYVSGSKAGPSFLLTVNPSTLSLEQGASLTSTVIVISVRGFSGTVSLSLFFTGSQLPASLSPGSVNVPVNGTARSTLTVTGTAGSRTHSTVISLTVVDPIVPPPVVESLKLSTYQFNNSTSLSLTLQNNGNTSVTLQSYVVRDASGNTWSLSNFAGPVITPNGFGTAIILIGANCPRCVHGGIPGLFFQFTSGQSYTVTVTTTRNNQFSFPVTR